ncbi:MAG: hypothetical protein LBL58_16285 [Tannerellaceae bacterium]|jgi:hypothetical protein|nr:hypothetical protein [Tannerellaceae bacterium]
MISFTFLKATQLFDYEETQSYRYFTPFRMKRPQERTTVMPDFRHTLLWELSLQNNGEETFTILFHISNILGTYIPR